MSRLNPVTFSDLVRKLKALDLEGPFSGGKHLFMIKGDYHQNHSDGGISFSRTWSMVKLAAFCRGGNSWKVLRNLPT